jgi:hypothetical protein
VAAATVEGAGATVGAAVLPPSTWQLSASRLQLPPSGLQLSPKRWLPPSTWQLPSSFREPERQLRSLPRGRALMLTVAKGWRIPQERNPQQQVTCMCVSVFALVSAFVSVSMSVSVCVPVRACC